MTPAPTVQDETANNSDDSSADGIQSDHADQQEPEHHEGGAALTVTVSPCDHHFRNADQKCNGKEHPAGLGEPKPVTEPSPIASESRHARSLDLRNERHVARVFGMTPPTWPSGDAAGALHEVLGAHDEAELLVEAGSLGCVEQPAVVSIGPSVDGFPDKFEAEILAAMFGHDVAIGEIGDPVAVRDSTAESHEHRSW